MNIYRMDARVELKPDENMVRRSDTSAAAFAETGARASDVCQRGNISSGYHESKENLQHTSKNHDGMNPVRTRLHHYRMSWNNLLRLQATQRNNRAAKKHRFGRSPASTTVISKIAPLDMISTDRFFVVKRKIKRDLGSQVFEQHNGGPGTGWKWM